MNKGSTLFLKGVIILIGLVVLVLCAYVLPRAIDSENLGYLRPILYAMYVPTVPFFYALYQGLLLLSYIDKNNAFSDLSVKALKYIKYCSIFISSFYALSLLYIFFTPFQSVPPSGPVAALIIIVNLIITSSSVVVGVFAALLQKLLQNGMEIKSENDLTV